MDYVWLWRTTRDPNRPHPSQADELVIPRPRAIPHPLAERSRERCRVLAQGRNGNRLIEFADGHRVVAPYYAVVPA